MWLDCGTTFVNVDHLDHIVFEQSEQAWTATLTFASGETLIFEHTDIKLLKEHFRKVMKNGHGAGTGTPNKSAEMGP